MDILEFFKITSILGIGLLLFSFFIFLLLKDMIYKIHSKFFNISKDRMEEIFYLIYGIFKVLIFIAFIIPYIALSIIK
nr:hypothetical protein [uncultured Cetobacterium sp.]